MKFEIKKGGNSWKVLDVEAGIFITKEIPEENIAQEICDDFNKMSSGAYSPLMEMFPPDLVLMEQHRLAWSLKTFTEATPISSLRKAESEIKEIEKDIEEGKKNPEEYADVIMCILDSAGRQGISIEEILRSYQNKMVVNESRTWVKNPDNSYSHI